MVNGVHEFAAFIVNLKPFKSEIWTLRKLEKRWSLQNYIIVESVCILSCLFLNPFSIFQGAYLLGIQLLNIKSQPWCKQHKWICKLQLLTNALQWDWLSLAVSKLSFSFKPNNRLLRTSPKKVFEKKLSAMLENFKYYKFQWPQVDSDYDHLA